MVVAPNINIDYSSNGIPAHSPTQYFQTKKTNHLYYNYLLANMMKGQLILHLLHKAAQVHNVKKQANSNK